MKRFKSTYATRHPQGGLTLIELMISLVIGLVIVIAMTVTYVGSGRSGKYQAAFAQMNEDAQIAMTLLSREFQLAGYASPVGVAGGGTSLDLNPAFPARAIVGCDTGFNGAPDVSIVVLCNAAPGASPAIEVGYEADLENTVPTGGYPSDCLGNALGNAPAAFFRARNRYYIANSAASGRPELHCASYPNAASRAGQPLVENIDAWQIWYGERNAEAAVPPPRQIVRYVTAGNVTDWDNVLAVRVCLLVRSAERVVTAEEPYRYLDCNSAQQVVADGFLRRAYFMTSTVRSRMAF